MNCREYGGTSLSKVFPSTHLSASGRSCLQSKGFRGIPGSLAPDSAVLGRKLTLAQKRRSTDLHLYPSPANATPQYGDIGGDMDGFRQQHYWGKRFVFDTLTSLFALVYLALREEKYPLSDRCSYRFLLGAPPPSVSIKWGVYSRSQILQLQGILYFY